MNVMLSELLTTEYTLSTPFHALLGRVPVQVFAVLERTAVLQIIGEDDRRVVRHDFITVDPDRLRARPTPLVDQLHRSRERGRRNSIKTHEKNGHKDYVEEYDLNESDWPEYDPLEKLAHQAEEDSD